MTTKGLKPPYYVLWVRETDAWGEEDLIYGFVHKGNSRFGHHDFKDVCEIKNQKVFFTNKVNDGANATFEECLEFLGERTQPIGNPILLTDRIYSFAEAAKIGIEKKIFPSPAGVTYLAKRTKPPATSVLAKPGENVGLKEMLARGKNMSDEFNRQKALAGHTTSDQSLALLSGLAYAAEDDVEERTVSSEPASSPAVFSFEDPSSRVIVPPTMAPSAVTSPLGIDTPDVPDISQVEDSSESLDSMTRLVLEEEIESWKRKAKEAVVRFASLEDETKKLNDENISLKSQLASAQEKQKQFMVSSDKALVANQSMNEDTATVVSKKVVATLSKSFEKLDGVAKEVSKVSEIVQDSSKLDDIVVSVASLGNTVGKLDSVEKLVTSMDDEMTNMGQFMTKMSEFMEKLSPCLQRMPGLVSTEVGELFERKTVDIMRGFESVTSRINTTYDSLEDGITVTNTTLENFGMGEGENVVDIPGCVKLLCDDLHATDEADTSVAADAFNDGLEDFDESGGGGGFVAGRIECFYVARGKPATYRCTCGCGSEVCMQAESTLGKVDPVPPKPVENTPVVNQSEPLEPSRREKRKVRQQKFLKNKKAKKLNFSGSQESSRNVGERKGFSIDRSAPVSPGNGGSFAPRPPVWIVKQNPNIPR